jgi:DNA-binding transcriptional regulator GbsR (MarR family)
MEKSHLLIVAIIIGAGILGGITNFLMLFDNDLKSKELRIKFFASLFLSLCASTTVPLFLQILSNNILDQLSFKNSLIFAGFCILASFFSKRFLEDVYAKVQNLEKKVDDQKRETKKELQDSNRQTEAVNKKVEDLEESIEESEYDNIPTEIKDAITSNNTFSFSSSDLENLITALFSAKYSSRTIGGISKETGIDKDKIKEVMEHLQEYGFAERKVAYNGKDLWRILKQPVKIYSANYGITGKFVDVTSKIKELVANKIFDGPVSPSFLGVEDPAFGMPKILKIHCRIHGKETELSFADGHTFKII